MAKPCLREKTGCKLPATGRQGLCDHHFAEVKQVHMAEQARRTSGMNFRQGGQRQQAQSYYGQYNGPPQGDPRTGGYGGYSVQLPSYGDQSGYVYGYNNMGPPQGPRSSFSRPPSVGSMGSVDIKSAKLTAKLLAKKAGKKDKKRSAPQDTEVKQDLQDEIPKPPSKKTKKDKTESMTAEEREERLMRTNVSRGTWTLEEYQRKFPTARVPANFGLGSADVCACFSRLWERNDSQGDMKVEKLGAFHTNATLAMLIEADRDEWSSKRKPYYRGRLNRGEKKPWDKLMVATAANARLTGRVDNNAIDVGGFDTPADIIAHLSVLHDSFEYFADKGESGYKAVMKKHRDAWGKQIVHLLCMIDGTCDDEEAKKKIDAVKGDLATQFADFRLRVERIGEDITWAIQQTIRDSGAYDSTGRLRGVTMQDRITQAICLADTNKAIVSLSAVTTMHYKAMVWLKGRLESELFALIQPVDDIIAQGLTGVIDSFFQGEPAIQRLPPLFPVFATASEQLAVAPDLLAADDEFIMDAEVGEEAVEASETRE